MIPAQLKCSYTHFKVVYKILIVQFYFDFKVQIHINY